NNHNPVLNASSSATGDTIVFTTSDIDVNDTVQIWWDSSIANANWQINTTNPKRPKGILILPPLDTSKKTPNFFTVSAKDNSCPLYGFTSKAYYRINPNALINITNLGCGKYNFKAISINTTLLNFAWTINNGNEILGDSIIKQFDKPGIYPLSLSVSNNLGDTNLYYDTLTTDSFLFVNSLQDTNICSGNSLTISLQISNNKGYTSINWNTNDTTQSIQTAQLFQDKTYTAIIQDQAGCFDTVSMDVDVNSIFVNHGQDIGFCIFDSISLDVNYILNGGNSSSLEWTKLYDTNFTKNKKNIIIHDSGTYICKITDNIGCYNSDTIFVTEYSLPNIYTLDEDSICSDEQEYLLNGKAFPLSGIWSGQGVIKRKSNYIFDLNNVTFFNGKKFTFNYLFTDSNNCKNSDSFSFRVFKSPENPNAGDDFELCKYDSLFQLNGYPKNGFWIGNFIDSFGNFSPSLAGIGSSKQSYIVGMPHCPKYDTVEIKVNPLPNIQIYPANNKFKMCKEEGLVYLNHSPMGGNYGGYWT
ncbi:MAG: hypothetical protein U9R42_14530, partial [Bacteroidota bacterium]|nr:hypothetical protein [Bacteroidota bacterium]